MYGLKPDIDLTFFIGKTLLQVCIGNHDLILNFADSISVAITSAIGISNIDGTVHRYEDFRKAATLVLSEVGQEVVSIKGSTNGTLELIFASKRMIHVYDDSQVYESYVIRYGTEEIVV